MKPFATGLVVGKFAPLHCGHEKLINTALANFKKRAEQIKTSMGRAEYRVARLDVQAANDFQPPMMRMAVMDAAPMAAPAPPSLESGKQKLKVNVQAEIELSIN